jgi:Uma2 family endonuclease
VITAERPLTYDDLIELPDDGLRREVIGGKLIVSPAPTAGHQDVIGNLYTMIRVFAHANGGHVYLAPLDVVLGPTDIVQPDLIYLVPTRPRVLQDQHALMGTPDLVVEVLSPGTGRVDRTTKLSLYAAAGVPEYWIADPVERLLVVRVLACEDYVRVEPNEDGSITSSVLSGMRIDPDEVFAGLA